MFAQKLYQSCPIMEIVLTALGETKLPFVKEGLAYYLKKLSHSGKFRVQVLADVRHAGRYSEAERTKLESDLMLKNVISGYAGFRLDDKGNMIDSEALARQIQAWQLNSVKGVQFFVGGPYGFSPEFIGLFPNAYSLSPLTFPHDLVRLIFAEQIYRAYSILSNSPYHHGS
jgi:23S rRNA (pseudouridine1915-N3)-methyltransferase